MWTVKECNFLEGGKANRVEKRIFFFFLHLSFQRFLYFIADIMISNMKKKKLSFKIKAQEV